jgi:hypothetical protein
MSCHKYHVRTFNWPWAWRKCAKVDKGRLKVDSVRDRILAENSRLSAYFEHRVEWQALKPVSTQNEGSSQYAIENKGRGICTGMF